jgi:hypothetical protein
MASIVGVFFLFRVENYHECLSLLGLIFAIELLYSGAGRFALIGGYGVVILFLLARSLIQGFEDWQNTVFTKELYIFTAIAFFSLFWGHFFLNGFRLFAINLLFGLLIFFMTHFVCMNRNSFFYITLFLILILVANALYGISVFITSGDRARSLFVDTPTYSGHFFVQGLCLSLTAFLAPPFRKMKKILLTFIIVLLIAVFLSITRAAWLAMFFLAILVLFFSPIPKRYLVYGLVLTLLALLLTLTFVSQSQLMWAIQDRVTMDIKNASLNMGSIAFRVLLWQSAWDIFMQNPLIGIGFDNFVLKNLSTAYFPFLKALGGEGLYVHNVYLQIVAELGLLGLFAFLNLLRVVYSNLLNIIKSIPEDDFYYLVLGYGVVLTLWLFKKCKKT